MPALIEVNALRKRFGDIEALAGVSFHVAAGEIYGLLGPNGAGKSTTINILCGLIRPDGGDARLNGIDVVQRPVDARRVLGVVPQEVALYSDLSARDNLAFFGRLYGLRGTALSRRIHTVLEQVNLADRAKEPIERYSGGMLRRLNIAAGILHEPRIVLFDEPTVGLDPQSRAAILDLVRAIATNAAVVYTTHYLDEAERLCDRLAIIDHGTVLAEGSLAELRKAAGEREIIAIFASALHLAIIAIARNERSASFMGSGLIMVLSLLGGTFFPAEQMPAFLRDIAFVMPNGAAQQGFVDVLAHGRTLAEASGRIFVTWGWALVVMAIAVAGAERRAGRA